MDCFVDQLDLAAAGFGVFAAAVFPSVLFAAGGVLF